MFFIHHQKIPSSIKSSLFFQFNAFVHFPLPVRHPRAAAEYSHFAPPQATVHFELAVELAHFVVAAELHWAQQQPIVPPPVADLLVVAVAVVQ
jgi:hypothetical protein